MARSRPVNPASAAQCSGDGPRAHVKLPVLPGASERAGGIRRSKNGRKRAVVLGIVQLLIIAHIVQWAITGRTTSPIEPSEAMEFTKYGVVNAGLIFFSLALLSTLVLGRWFCGWGCHLVLLQDLCGWMMKKIGVRPKPFRSRLLIYVPLILALYMFIWPAAYRWGVVPLDAWAGEKYGDEHALVTGVRQVADAIGIPLGEKVQHVRPWSLETELTTEKFWQTFPGVMVAIPFLLICGFACVYFLGSKGFCTYGCPYGGFFAPLDKLSPARIRVTDACEGCGHCTAVCTSNVRVHEEVRDYGMVVDPGCMKCLDCVSVCPKEALYFGFGSPSIAAKPRDKRVKPRDRQPLALPSKRYDLTWSEEIAFSLIFLLSFLAFRGVYVGLIPVLMAIGIAGVVTFTTWKLWRLMRDANVNFHRWRLRYHGRWTRAGAIFAACAGLAVLLTAHSGIVRTAQAVGGYFDDRVEINPDIVFFGQLDAEALEPLREHAGRAIAAYRLASGLGHGGIGLLTFGQAELDERFVWLHSVRGEFDEAERIARHALDRDGRTQRFSRNLAMTLLAQERYDEALDFVAEVLREEPGYTVLLDNFMSWCDDLGRLDLAIDVCDARLAREPTHVHTMNWRARLHFQKGRMDEGIALLRSAIQIEPENITARSTLALALAQRGDFDGAHEALLPALRANPDHLGLHRQMAALLQAMGRLDEARAHYDRIAELQQR